jgi:hypothetical protein
LGAGVDEGAKPNAPNSQSWQPARALEQALTKMNLVAESRCVISS